MKGLVVVVVVNIVIFAILVKLDNVSVRLAVWLL